jgi:hypothetical protein
MELTCLLAELKVINFLNLKFLNQFLTFPMRPLDCCTKNYRKRWDAHFHLILYLSATSCSTGKKKAYSTLQSSDAESIQATLWCDKHERYPRMQLLMHIWRLSKTWNQPLTNKEKKFAFTLPGVKWSLWCCLEILYIVCVPTMFVISWDRAHFYSFPEYLH